MKRIIKASEYFLRQFHKEVRLIRERLDEKGQVLKTYNEADDDDICITSFDESEKGYYKDELDKEGEKYFMTAIEYNKMLDDEFYFT
jgi:hypothetical protein